MTLLVSAPGKVIIFGEHAAVYGKPAIAAALSLRAYLLCTPNSDPDTISLEFADINLQHSWKRSEIPWDTIDKIVPRENGRPAVTEELLPELTGALAPILMDLESNLHYTACHCFLYLYTSLCGRDTPGMSFCVRSTLPIGAGLGSSASTAVCLAGTLAYLGGHVSAPTYAEKDRFGAERAHADYIDAWSLMGEKCFHGNPSGIDNAVATHGGAVMFQRNANPENPAVKTTIRNLPPIRLLLTNTRVPRSTAEKVAGVGRLNHSHARTTGAIFDAIAHVTTDAYQLMVRPTFGEEEKASLRDLVGINHGLLVALGVSHPALERVKIIGDSIGATKLTGAGGGGCAITLVANETEDKVEEVVKRLHDEGFETFEASLGGKGVGAVIEADVTKEDFLGYGSREEVTGGLGGLEWRYW